MSEVTRILRGAQLGDSAAKDELLPLIYDELRKLAAAKMAREQPGQTLQPTALVHERKVQSAITTWIPCALLQERCPVLPSNFA